MKLVKTQTMRIIMKLNLTMSEFRVSVENGFYNFKLDLFISLIVIMCHFIVKRILKEEKLFVNQIFFLSRILTYMYLKLFFCFLLFPVHVHRCRRHSCTASVRVTNSAVGTIRGTSSVGHAQYT